MTKFQTVRAADTQSIETLVAIGRKLHGFSVDAEQSPAELQQQATELGERLVNEQVGFAIVKGHTRVEMRAESEERPLCYGPTSHDIGWQTARLLVKDMGIYVLSGVTALMLRGTLVDEHGEDTGNEVDVALFEGVLIREI